MEPLIEVWGKRGSMLGLGGLRHQDNQGLGGPHLAVSLQVENDSAWLNARVRRHLPNVRPSIGWACSSRSRLTWFHAVLPENRFLKTGRYKA